MNRNRFLALVLLLAASASANASTLLEVNLPRGIVLTIDGCSIESHQFGPAPDGSIVAHCPDLGSYTAVDRIAESGFDKVSPQPVGAWDFHAILQGGPTGPGMPAWVGSAGCGALVHETNAAGDALFVLVCDHVDSGE